MDPSHPIVQLIAAAGFAFAISWILAYLLGHRVRRGHWLASLIYVAALLGLSRWLVDRLAGPAPSGIWWIPMGVLALLIIALTESWNALGQACMASTVSLSALFWVDLVLITLRAHLGPLSLLLSIALLVLQTFAMILLCAGSYEILDVLCRIRWRRVAEPRPTTDWFPRVSLHLPAYNEPPEMVVETLDALARLDYPNYEVLVIDNNTSDERLWR